MNMELEGQKPKAENNIQDLIKLYDSVGLETRNMKFLAKWYYKMFDFAHLPSIDESCNEQLVLDKLRLTVFNILADDLVDNSKIRNKELFNEVSRIPWDTHHYYENDYLEVARKTWCDFKKSMEQYPRYEEFKDLFNFDLEQFFDSMKYSMLVNTMGIDNPLETRMYLPHNMQIVLFLDLDLMCSPDFNKEELGYIRQVFLYTQDLLHLSHVLSTYVREVQELDYSSPMISLAIDKEIISKEDIEGNPEVVLAKLEGLHSYFKDIAKEKFNKIKELAEKITSVDINDFYVRVKKVYDCFLVRSEYWVIEKEQVVETVMVTV